MMSHAADKASVTGKPQENNLPKEKQHSCFFKNLFTCQVESQNFKLENSFDLSVSNLLKEKKY